MLGQRLNRRQRLQFLGARPVIGELIGMEACPRPDEPQRTRWKRPIEYSQRRELDLSDLIAVLCMEVGRRMIGAIHPYNDSVERGQTRHRAIVGYSSAAMADLPSARGRRESEWEMRFAEQPSLQLTARGQASQA